MSDEIHPDDVDEAYLRGKTMSQYEVAQLVSPLRECLGQIVGTLVQIVPRIIEQAQDDETKNALFAGYERLGPVFDALNNFDASLLRLYNGLDIDDDSMDELRVEVADE